MCLVFLVGVSACGRSLRHPRHRSANRNWSPATVTESAGALPLKKKNGPESAKPEKNDAQMS